MGSRLLITLYIAVLYLPWLRLIYHENDPYLTMDFQPHSLDIFQIESAS